MAVELLKDGEAADAVPREAEETTSVSDVDAARCELMRAEAVWLRAEASLMEDLGALVKGMAAHAEALADLTIVEKEQREHAAAELKDLYLDKTKSELERVIAENREKARRSSERDSRPRHQGGNGRHDQRRGSPPASRSGKEVAVGQKGFSNGIKGAEGLAAPSPSGAQAAT